MVCDCILSKEDRINGFRGCGDDCLNRMLMIEWYVLSPLYLLSTLKLVYFFHSGSRCTLGDLCSNKRFSLVSFQSQSFVLGFVLTFLLSPKKQYAKVEPFKTLNKGWGLRTLEDLPP